MNLQRTQWENFRRPDGITTANRNQVRGKLIGGHSLQFCSQSDFSMWRASNHTLLAGMEQHSCVESDPLWRFPGYARDVSEEMTLSAVPFESEERHWSLKFDFLGN
jgi:beta-galactosidase/beta-glucuronidase